MAAQITAPRQSDGLARWRWVVLAAALSLPLALATAGAGFLFMNAVGGPTAELDSWGTTAWAASAVLLGGPAAVVPGPGRVLRVIVGLVVAVLWFVVGRYLLLQR